MRLSFFVVLSLMFVIGLQAQIPATIKPVKIAVFAPVYLDSAFTGDNYKLGRNSLPRYMLSGLDFYNGVMLAIDSLNKENAAIEVLVYDSKSVTMSIEQTITDSALQDISLIIASFTARNEIKPLADFALEKKIPLISATYPTDGGITENPFFIMLNPKLDTHIEAVYNYLHRFFPTNNIILFRKQGNTEDRIQSILENMNRKTPGTKLKMKTVELADSFTVKQVTDYLDSNKQNIVVAGSLNEDFGTELSKALGSSKNYNTILIGMPTWDGLRDISKNQEIIYSSPYNFTRVDKISLQLFEKYKTKFAGRPGDMVFKGFEAMYRFTKLLLKYGDSLTAHLSDKDHTIFNNFNIQPVRSNKESVLPDYLENKKLYFIRKMDGKIKSVN